MKIAEIKRGSDKNALSFSKNNMECFRQFVPSAQSNMETHWCLKTNFNRQNSYKYGSNTWQNKKQLLA